MLNKKYKSKVDWWLHLTFIIMLILNIWLIVDFIISPSFVMGISGGVILICNIFTLPWWLNSYYFLEEEQLLINIGYIKVRIPYKSVESIQETRIPWASMALSLDRIEIKYKKKNFAETVLISPVRKQEFLKELNQRVK